MRRPLRIIPTKFNEMAYILFSAIITLILFWVFFRQQSRRENVVVRVAQEAHVIIPLPPVFQSRMVEIIDGDTVRLFYQERWILVRLHGIDAPEIKQRTLTPRKERGTAIGLQAREALKIILTTSSVTCRVVDRDRYGRTVGFLSTPEHPDVGRLMVRSGWACAYLAYGGEIYEKDEAYAKRENLGIWQHEFIKPWWWRRVYT